MVKFREASPGAAYEIAIGVTDAEEAAELGLAVVESTAEGRPAAYGRYKGAPDGGPLGVTVDRAAETDVIAAGTVAPRADDTGAGNKGDFVNMDDPFVHGGTGPAETIHADGSAPGKTNKETDTAAVIAEAQAANNKAAKKGR